MASWTLRNFVRPVFYRSNPGIPGKHLCAAHSIRESHAMTTPTTPIKSHFRQWRKSTVAAREKKLSNLSFRIPVAPAGMVRPHKLRLDVVQARSLDLVEHRRVRFFTFMFVMQHACLRNPRAAMRHHLLHLQEYVCTDAYPKDTGRHLCLIATNRISLQA